MIARRWLAVLVVFAVLAIITWTVLVPASDLAMRNAFMGLGGVVHA